MTIFSFYARNGVKNRVLSGIELLCRNCKVISLLGYVGLAVKDAFPTQIGSKN